MDTRKYYSWILTLMFCSVMLLCALDKILLKNVIRDKYIRQANVLEAFANYEPSSVKTNAPNSDSWRNEEDFLRQCPKMDGKNEWRQLERSWRDLLQIPNNQNISMVQMAKNISEKHLYGKFKTNVKDEELSYNISILQTMKYSNGNCTVIMFRIQEFFQNSTTNSLRNFTNGGSSFTITASGYDSAGMRRTNIRHTLTHCPFDDYFNGTYLACCSLHARHTKLQVERTHTNYTAYKKAKTKATVIHRQDVSLSYMPDINHAPPSYNYGDKKLPLLPYPTQYWILNGSEKDAILVENEHSIKFYNGSQVKECYEEKFHERVHMLGDSHIAYIFFYFLTFIKLPEVKRVGGKIFTDVSIPPYKMRWTTMSTQFVNNIKMLERDMREDKSRTKKTNSSFNFPQALVLDNGIHEQSDVGTHAFVANFPKVIDKLKSFKSFLDTENITMTMIWQTVPSFSYTGNILGVYWRNSHIIGAMNYWTCSLLSELHIPCIDAWSTSLAWQNKLVCKDHILCARKDTITGVPGKFVAQKLLQKLCTNDNIS